MSRPRHWRSVPVPRLSSARRTVVRGVARVAPAAQVGDRALAATRCAGRADQRAELHRGGRPAMGVVLGHQGRGQLALGRGERCVRELLAGDDAGEHPSDIGVEHDVALPEGEGCDGCGGVLADSRQREQRPRATRAPRRRGADDRRCGGVQPQCAARIAERPTRVRLRRSTRWPGRRASASARSRPRRPAARGTTGVCWSMNSETMTAHGDASRRHGRSRPASSNQLMMLSCSWAVCGGHGESILARGAEPQERGDQ